MADCISEKMKFTHVNKDGFPNIASFTFFNAGDGTVHPIGQEKLSCNVWYNIDAKGKTTGGDGGMLNSNKITIRGKSQDDNSFVSPDLWPANTTLGAISESFLGPNTR